MSDLMQYEKGFSPCAIQRKYGLTYVQGYELAERLKKAQELREENTKLKTENKWYSEQLNEAVKKIDKLKEQQKLTTDCKTLAQKLLQVKPELRDWLEVNFKEYL